MKIHLPVFRSLFGGAVAASAALGGFLLFATAPAAKADPRFDCDRRVAYTQYRYNVAVERYGPYSSSARHWAHERHEAFERCEHFRHEWRERHRDRDDRYYRDWERR